MPRLARGDQQKMDAIAQGGRAWLAALEGLAILPPTCADAGHRSAPGLLSIWARLWSAHPRDRETSAPRWRYGCLYFSRARAFPPNARFSQLIDDLYTRSRRSTADDRNSEVHAPIRSRAGAGALTDLDICRNPPSSEPC